jgi:hypothetical protein
LGIEGVEAIFCEVVGLGEGQPVAIDRRHLHCDRILVGGVGRHAFLGERDIVDIGLETIGGHENGARDGIVEHVVDRLGALHDLLVTGEILLDLRILRRLGELLGFVLLGIDQRAFDRADTGRCGGG